ncbi:hybrid sensor histidine kinase/response regulator [Flavobacterium crassostreae]|uniref:histidine kinase n=1 Tax=Flavobacterium crassostreae TaxID=1763534 RepID=A0A1B9E3H6_9FLAO|nr:hybrid sensor histidine kinase/response regulator [Flavobacterium crassostreae]OCB76487.1 hypothetical protein LPBF_05990 [Flavobacterium crassostreae]
MKKITIRKAVLIALFFSILLTQILLYKTWSNQNQDKQTIAHNLEDALQPNLSLLYSNQATKHYLKATNNFNEYLLSHQADNLKNYKVALDSMAFYLGQLSILSKTDSGFSKVINRKKGTEKAVATLQTQLDSLINSKKNIGTQNAKVTFSIQKYDYNKVLSSITYDTVKKVSQTNKKSLFGRIGNALKGKLDTNKEETQSVIKMVFNNQEKSGSFEEQLRNSFQLTEQYYIRNLNSIKNTYNLLKAKDYELLEINKKIVQKSQEILLFYTKSSQEDSKIKYLTSYQKYQNELDKKESTILNLLLLMSLATILLLLYTIYAYVRESNLYAAKQVTEKNLNNKNQLIGMLSHEMRAPLSIISNFSKKLKKQNSNPELTPVIHSLDFASSSLQMTVSQILEFLKNENNQLKAYPSKMNIQQEIQPLVDSLQSLSEAKNITLVSNLDPSTNIAVWADNVKIHQLFYNLIVNAIKFTNQGTITVNTKISTHQNKYRLEVAITDTGIGISEQDIGSIFDKFYQSSNNKSQRNYGAGLGLSLCKDIVTLFDGKITAKSTLNVGTQMTFYLLLEPLKPELESYQTQLKNKFKDQSITIAVVDDDALTLRVVKKLIENVGFKAAVFERAPQITAYLNQHVVDLIVTDIQIFDYSGIELSKDIKKSNNPNQSKPIMALTSDTYIGSKTAVALGFDATIIKPVNKEEFYEKILNLLCV